MLLSSFMTLGLVPLGFIFSYLHLLPISLAHSLLGSFSGFIFLFIIAKIYFWIAKRIGLGQGDIDLIAGIGAFLGIVGWWITLVLASCVGTIIGLCIILAGRKSITNVKIPFGPFLAIGAMTYVLFSPYLTVLIR